MTEKNQTTDTVALLQQCCAGCTMATESLEQIKGHVDDPTLREVILRYNKEHIALGAEIHEMLNETGEPTKEPGAIAKAFSWVQSEVKLSMNESNKKVAGLLIDGCNMGIKTLMETKNQSPGANEKSISLCEKLISLEKKMIEELETYL